MLAAIPVTTPVIGFTVAAAGCVLIHIPPAVVLLSVIVLSGHTSSGPVMALGCGITVTALVV